MDSDEAFVNAVAKGAFAGMHKPPYVRKEVIGSCTLYQGSCLDVLPSLTGSFDSMVTDPPYGIDLKPQRGLTKAIEGDGRAEAQELWASMLSAAVPLLNPNTGHLFWTGWSETWTKELLAQHFTVKSCVVWAKNMWGIGYYTRPQHEFAWYCHLGKPPLPDEADSDLWQMQKIQAPIHSCEKPVPLLQRSIKLAGGDSILDPFMGVGPSAVAAQKMGKRYVGIELDAGYFEIACERVERAFSQPDMLIEALPVMEQTALALD